MNFIYPDSLIAMKNKTDFKYSLTGIDSRDQSTIHKEFVILLKRFSSSYNKIFVFDNLQCCRRAIDIPASDKVLQCERSFATLQNLNLKCTI